MSRNTHDAFAGAINNKKPELALTPEGVPLAKFSLEMDSQTDIAFEQLRLTLKRKIGKSVSKADVLRSLIMLAADDATLVNQIALELQAKQPQTGR